MKIDVLTFAIIIFSLGVIASAVDLDLGDTWSIAPLQSQPPVAQQLIARP